MPFSKISQNISETLRHLFKISDILSLRNL